MKAKAYSYLRFSTPEQSKGDSFRRQTENAKRYAELHDLELDETLTFQDLGVSAYRGNNARGGNALGDFLYAVNSGIIEEGCFLLVESLDRMSRDDINEAMGIFILLINRGIVIVTLIDNKEYSKTGLAANPYDMMMSVGIMIRAHEESATKSRRLKAVWENKRKTADKTPMTACAPKWLTMITEGRERAFRVIEERAETVRQIYELTLRGMGLIAIAKKLSSENVPVFGKSKGWHRTFVAALLETPAVIGTYIPHTLEHLGGKKVRKPQLPIKNYFPAIIDKETYERVRALRLNTTSPLRGRHASNELHNVFGGLARCPLCGESMTLVNKGKKCKYKYMVCSSARIGIGCKYRSIPYPRVEGAFLSESPNVFFEIPPGDKAPDLEDKIVQLEESIEQQKEGIQRLLKEIVIGSSISVSRELRKAENQLDEMEKELTELYAEKEILAEPMIRRRVDDLLGALGKEPLDKLLINTLLRQLFDKVVVNYPNGTLDFHWKHGGINGLMYGWPTKEQG